MFKILAKKRESRLRKAMLKGVYEDNIRLVSRYSAPGSGKVFFFMKKMLLFAAVVILMVLGNGQYVNITLFPEKQLSANLILQTAPSTAPQQSTDPSEYKPFMLSNGMPLSRMFGLGVKTIMIDPGHGGSDSGTVGKLGAKEKDIVLDIAKRLRERLKKNKNYNVILTRDDDRTLPLNKRVELAGAARADIFVSIHLNYLPSKPINMIETYYFGPSSDARALKLAEQENTSSQYSLSDFREVIAKIGQTMKLQESKGLASSIQKKLFINSRKSNESIQNFGVKRAPFIVLVGVDIPSVLAEVSCLSNKAEEIELNTPAHRENLARYLEAGILDYLIKGESSYESKRR